MIEFSHLHNHSEYSVLDGMAFISNMAKDAKKDGQRGLGLTDHGTMGGIGKLIEEAKKHDIIPVPGIEIYRVPSYPEDPEERKYTIADLNETEGKERFHQTMWAVNNTGYRNLMEMSSIAWGQTHKGRPLFTNDMLSQSGMTDGIVASTGCVGSRFNQALVRGDEDLARSILEFDLDIFGDRFYMEVMDHDIPDQVSIIPDQLRLAKEYNIPLLATNDVHYTCEEHAYPHEVMLAMQTGAKMSTPDRFKFSSYENWMRTRAQMEALFPDDEFPDALLNTHRIVEMAQDVNPYKDGEYLIPVFPDAQGDDEGYLRKLVNEGIKRKYGSRAGDKDVSARVEYELKIIHDMGFDSYFLIVWDMIKWCRDNGVRLGPGRGSGAGSIVAYALDITIIDPLEYNLYFERFLNPSRLSMPDIDTDIDPLHRANVRRYMAQKYGDDRVGVISTYGALKAKSAIKKVGSTLEFSVAKCQQLADLATDDTNIKQALAPLSDLDGVKDEEEKKQIWHDSQGLIQEIDGDEKLEKLIELSGELQGVISSRSVHAGGILVTPTEMWNYMPSRDRDKESDLRICEFDKNIIEHFGGLKIDALGLITLREIQLTVERIKENKGIDLIVEDIPLDDEATYEMLRKGDVTSVFQLDGQSGMRDLVIAVQPTCFDDLSAIVALYRPGPIESGTHTAYALRKNGKEKITTIHPEMKELLSDTFGLPVYQEDIMALATHFAGFTGAQADNLRKATGKKDPELLKQQEDLFKEGAIKNGYDPKVIDKMWEYIIPFAEYAFNKSHSVAYGFNAYWTAYLKRHYPAEFIAGIFDGGVKDTKKGDKTISKYAKTADWGRKNGVVIHLPDVNKSGATCKVENDEIYMSMGRVPNVGDSIIPFIVQAREEGGEFTSILDFCTRVLQAGGRLNSRSVISLINVGAFDALHKSRQRMIDCVPEILKEAKVGVHGALTPIDTPDLFGDISDDVQTDDAGSRFGLDDVESDISYGTKILYETQALGFFAKEHPFSFMKGQKDKLRKNRFITKDYVSMSNTDPYAKWFYGICSDPFKAIQTKGKRCYLEIVVETDDRKETISIAESVENKKILQEIQEELSETMCFVSFKAPAMNQQRGKFGPRASEIDIYPLDEVIEALNSPIEPDTVGVIEIDTPEWFDDNAIDAMTEYIIEELSDIPNGKVAIRLQSEQFNKKVLRTIPVSAIDDVLDIINENDIGFEADYWDIDELEE